MPARNSILKKVNEQNNFAPVDGAIKLHKVVLNFCIKMPKRYTFYIGQDIYRLASAVLNHAKIANSIYVKDNNVSEMERRVLNWRQAYEYCQALSSKLNTLTDLTNGNNGGTLSGISFGELQIVIDALVEEIKYLSKTIKSESEKLKKKTMVE